ncbi:hypothetical protein C5167_030622 [Papaver somniferum]|nr:hypothetical protein C5167_030622 [Papaver somniferum]
MTVKGTCSSGPTSVKTVLENCFYRFPETNLIYISIIFAWYWLIRSEYIDSSLATSSTIIAAISGGGEDSKKKISSGVLKHGFSSKFETSALVISTHKPEYVDSLPLISKQALYLNILEDAEFTNNFIDAEKTLYHLISIKISKVGFLLMIRRVVYQPVRIEISYAMNHLTTMVRVTSGGCWVGGIVPVLWIVGTVSGNDGESTLDILQD